MKMKFRSGAASFYVVAFSTLILVIIAASFATAIVAEITRTSNADLAQSAYDAALAGVEDAKLAFMNYQNCIKNGATTGVAPEEGQEGLTCEHILYYMDNEGGQDCDMVAHILGRQEKGVSGEVLISETGGNDNGMDQAYTCVKIKHKLNDYQGVLSESQPYDVVKVDLADSQEAKDVGAVKIEWGASNRSGDYNPNAVDNNSGKVSFMPLDEEKNDPPTIAVQLIQTSESFTLEGGLNARTVYDNGYDCGTDGDKCRTDRATVYLVPKDASEGVRTTIEIEQVANTNNLKENRPYEVACNSEDYNEKGQKCSVIMKLPKPIGGEERIDDTFMFVVSLPAGVPETEFTLGFCEDSDDCENGKFLKLNGQVLIDSTGRANDLFKRVEIRLGTKIEMFPYAMESLGEGEEAGIKKEIQPETEHSQEEYENALDNWGRAQ